MVFTESVRSRQVPETPRTSAWPPSRPSMPTSRATRVTSSANDDSWSTIVLTVRPIRRNSPRSGRPSISQRHVLGQVALGDGLDHPGGLGGRLPEVVDQRVDRVHALGPRAVVGLLVEPLQHPALAADDPADPQQVAVAPLQQPDQRVELLDDLTAQPARQARVEAAEAHGAQGLGEPGCGTASSVGSVDGRAGAGPAQRRCGSSSCPAPPTPPHTEIAE